MSPQIKPIPDVVAYEGENTTLTCTASGVPTPDVKWISEGKEFLDEQVFIYNSLVMHSLFSTQRPTVKLHETGGFLRVKFTHYSRPCSSKHGCFVLIKV